MGPVFIAATAAGISYAAYVDSIEEQRELHRRHHNVRQVVDATIRNRLQQAAQWIDTPTPRMAIPLDMQGTPFQCTVWKALLTIPMGQTKTYSQVASEIGNPSAVRAVARACAANPIALLIPCHRVIRSDGGLGGYRWGLPRKESLLQREAALTNGGESEPHRAPRGSTATLPPMLT